MAGLHGINLPVPLAWFVPDLGGLIKFGGAFIGLDVAPKTVISVSILIVAGLAITLFAPSSQRLVERFQPDFRHLVYATILGTIILTNMQDSKAFIYFAF